MKTLILSLLVVSAVFGSETEHFKNVFFDRLELLMDFCIAHPETVDSGTMLGVLFAKGRLESHPERQNVVQLMRKSVALEKSFMKQAQKPTIPNKIVHELIFDSSVFKLKFPSRRLQPLSDRDSGFSSLGHYTRTLNDDRNLPNGVLSDRCLFEVLSGCQVSEDCFEIEDPRTSSFGYSQTHKQVLKNHFEVKRGSLQFFEAFIPVGNKKTFRMRLKILFFSRP